MARAFAAATRYQLMKDKLATVAIATIAVMAQIRSLFTVERSWLASGKGGPKISLIAGDYRIENSAIWPVRLSRTVP